MYFIRWFLSIYIFIITHQSFAQIHHYAAESVLNDGIWYKIGVTQTGVYRLDQSFLNSLGININEIDPRNIHIYGNGGGMLPQANDEFRHDDLVENSIEIVGEEDGRFDVGDYLLFYGQSPHIWNYDQDQDLFDHEFHLYADTNFYFVHVNETQGKRISKIANSSIPTYSPTVFRGMASHELDKENPEKSGRYWLGEAFSSIVSTREISLSVPNVSPNGEIRLRIRLASKADRATSFRIEADNRLIGTVSMSAISNSSIAAAYRTKTVSYNLFPSDLENDSLRISITYNAAASADARGWLDWIEVDYDKALNSSLEDVASFSLVEGVGSGEWAAIPISDPAYQVWDVTNPVGVKAYSISGSANGLVAEADSVKHFMVFKGGYLTPFNKGRVARQNLHGLDLADYIMITPPDFQLEAERLAQFHRDHYGRSVHVVHPQQIYNEFSSGKQDVSAIRNFIKMFYDQSRGQLPGFVLLFGDGTYDYKGILKDPTTNQAVGGNYIPTYQSRNSWSPVNSYTSDDFFVILDDHEGFWGENVRITGDPYILDNDNKVEVNLLDAAIGRLPIENAQQAKTIVDKIIAYASDPEGLGTWRNKVVLVADHKEGDGSIHISQADSYTNTILNSNPCVNLEKIYMDNYPAENTPSGIKFPKGKEALLAAFNEGSLLVNYTGHGSATAWSYADILLLNDIQDIQNPHHLPAYITATCSFGHYDDPDVRSGAETLLMMEDQRGSIAMFTTVRLVYSSPNARLNANLYKEIFKFDEDKGRMPTIGEVMMRTKNVTFPNGSTTNINSRNFTLLGDPGLILSYPSLQAKITKINGQIISQTKIDTLPSLSSVLIQGQIEDHLGNKIENFEGDVAITVFDKPSKFITRLSPFSFLWQKNRVFNGTSSIIDGEFEFSFVVPIDVSYDEGVGKISLYVSGQKLDGGGCYSNMYIGGTDVTVIPDNTGPMIDLFINDENWIHGGITNQHPFLHAKVVDSSGINTSGGAIGHEIIGILDGDEGNAFILNDYYTAEKDDYTRGLIRYQMRNLADGEHELIVRVWDGANNPSEAKTNFIVESDEKMVLHRIMNVPNPFNKKTEFWIEHNQANQELIAVIKVLALNGQLVKEFYSTFVASGNHYRLEWDGRSDVGKPLSNGIYVYQVLLRNVETGAEVQAVHKLAILR